MPNIWSNGLLVVRAKFHRESKCFPYFIWCFPLTSFIEVVRTLLELKVKSYKNVFYCFIKFMSLHCVGHRGGFLDFIDHKFTPKQILPAELLMIKRVGFDHNCVINESWWWLSLFLIFAISLLQGCNYNNIIANFFPFIQWAIVRLIKTMITARGALNRINAYC